MTLTLNNRPVCVTEIDGTPGEGAHAVEAYFEDSEGYESLSDDDLDALTRAHPAELYDDWFQTQVCRAENARDAMEDR